MICIDASVPATQIPQQLLQQQEKNKKKQNLAKIDAVDEGKAAVAVKPLMLMLGASGHVRALFSLRALRSLLLLLNGFLFLLPFRRRTIVVSAEEKWEKREAVVVRVPTLMVPRRAREVAAAGRAREVDVTTRRSMAVRRIASREEGDDGRSVREFSLFVSGRGHTLFTQSWSSTSFQTKGVVILLHGLNEHGGRYINFAKQLNESGFTVYAMDWIGHGGSDGLHGYVHSLDYAVNDLKDFLNKLLAENPGLPCFCFGHSTGGAIILEAVMDPKAEACIQGVVLTSPAIRVEPSHPILALVAPIFSLLIPRCQFSAANKKGPPVCRDPEALKVKYSDPLVFTGSIRVRTGYEILRISQHLQQNLSRVNIPFLVLHGTADTITDPYASKMLYHEASSIDKTIKLYDGFLHDLLFEPEHGEITGDIIKWLNTRLDAQS